MPLWEHTELLDTRQMQRLPPLPRPVDLYSIYPSLVLYVRSIPAYVFTQRDLSLCVAHTRVNKNS